MASQQQSRENCKEIKPHELNFLYGNDPRYWSMSKDGGPARAVQVLLLSVSGAVPVTKGTYRVSFNVSLKDDAFGWEGTPVLVAAKLGKNGKFTFKDANLSQVSSTQVTIPSETSPLQIVVPTNSGEIHFGLYELSKKKWKGGLEVHSATVQKIA